MTDLMTFEGALVPAAGELQTVLLDPDRRAALVRAAVVDEAVCDRLVGAAEAMLRGPAAQRGAALAVARALSARRLIAPILAAVEGVPDRWIGVADPERPGETLARSALDFAVTAAGPRRPDVRGALRRAMDVPELRPRAWHALGADDPDAVLPHLADLLIDTPELAGDVATRFALVHTERCLDACRQVAGLPEATRRAFGDALHKHLLRIFAVRRWVECRQALFGR